ncbi:MAG: caspase family protein [Pseudomonadota bacterium]
MTRLLLCFLALVCLVLPAFAEERRLALILANQDYPAELGRLTNTHEDAATVEAALQSVGFSVTKILDADADGLEDAITNFEIAIDAEAADGDDVVAFFYASMHGAAADVDGRQRNFLLPANETIGSTGQLIRKAQRVDQIISGLGATRASAVFFVSDACRNSLATAFSKSTNKGFVPERRDSRVLVAYATPPGSTTPDDGLFARVLAEEIRRGGERATVTMLDVVGRVGQQRGVDGRPFIAPGTVPNWFCFGGCRSTILGQTTDAGEALARAISVDTLAAYQEVERRFPNHPQIAYVRSRINALTPVRHPATLPEPNRRVRGDGTLSEVRPGMVDPALTEARQCDGGSINHCYNLGNSYRLGRGVTQDYGEAVRLYRLACEAGHMAGCSNWGFMYASGQGVLEDNVEAVILYRQACDGGYTGGCRNLGYMYANGFGVAEDDVEAARLYREACDDGDAMGCSNLGDKLFLGNGIDKNETEGIRLLRQGCAGGNEWGCDKLREFGYTP